MEQLPAETIKPRLLAILDFLDHVCTQHGLRYFGAFGTCLGAVRHGGMIPWDDDLDVVMPRADYERLREVMAEYADSPYVLKTRHDADYGLPFAKLVDNRTVVSDKLIVKRYNEKYGLFVDIFPLDGVPTDPKQQQKVIRRRQFYRKLNNLKYYNCRKNRFFVKLVKWGCKLVLLPFPPKFFLRKLDRWCQRYPLTADGMCAHGGNVVVMPTAVFGETVTKPFDTTTLKIPARYDEYLRTCYGDYLTPPPENQRFNHGLVVYQKDCPAGESQ